MSKQKDIKRYILMDKLSKLFLILTRVFKGLIPISWIGCVLLLIFYPVSYLIIGILIVSPFILALLSGKLYLFFYNKRLN